MFGNGLRALAGQLLYGDPASTDLVVADLLSRNDPQLWSFLVGALHSEEELPVRIRCLVILAEAAIRGGDAAAQQIVAALSAEEPPVGWGSTGSRPNQIHSRQEASGGIGGG